MKTISNAPMTWTRTMVAFASIALGFVYLIFASFFASFRLQSDDILGLAFFVAVAASPFVLRLRSMAAQIFGRAVLVQGALFFTLALINAAVLRDTSQKMFCEIIFALAVVVWPLLVIGRRGLFSASQVFSPSAFRTTLIASLLFGLADTWGLIFYSAMMENVGPMLVSAGVMSVALYGLYRMKVWGLGLCVVANVVIATLALTGAFDLPDILAWGLATTALVQLMLPVPLVVAMYKGARRLRLQE